MLPFAIPALASLASSSLERWNCAAEEPSLAKGKASRVNFEALLNGATGTTSQEDLAALPEVKAVLAGASSGTQVQLSIGADGSLSKIMPDGSKQVISLSAQSQAVVQQWATANPGASSLALVA
jgi:hypothetical protein